MLNADFLEIFAIRIKFLYELEVKLDGPQCRYDNV